MPATLIAQPKQLSLDESIEFALRNKAAMKNARIDQLSTDAQIKEITGLALPNLKATGGVNYAPNVPGFIVPNFTLGFIPYVNPSALNNDAISNAEKNIRFAIQPRWTTTAQLELTQILFDPSVLVALQGRTKLRELAAKNVQLSEQDTKINVTKAYYDVLIANRRMELIDQNVIRIGEIERETKVIYQNGFAEKIDVDRITVTLNNLKTEQIRIKQLVDLTYMNLKFQIGMPLDQPIILTDSLSENKLEEELLSEEFNVRNRKEYQLVELQKDLSLYDLKRYKLGGLPSLALFGNYGYVLYNAERFLNKGDEFQTSSLVGVRLTVPIFDGLQRRNKVKQAQFTVQKNENTLQDLRLGLQLESESARITLTSSLAALENQRANMRLAENVYNIARTKYKEGVGSSLEVIDAESSLKEAQVNYFSALYDVMNARISFQKALGEF
jgi:outer membrane protein TolC